MSTCLTADLIVSKLVKIKKYVISELVNPTYSKQTCHCDQPGLFFWLKEQIDKFTSCFKNAIIFDIQQELVLQC